MKAIDRIIGALKSSKRSVITAHVNLEGDSLGSQLAMANLLKCLGKKPVIIDDDEVPEIYRFLPGAKLVRHVSDYNNEKFDTAIVLDCPNLRRTGRVKGIVEKAKQVINIDHHVSNEGFGNLIWVEKNASSVGEMIYTLFKELSCEITKETALYLYISILTDTGSFNYSNTSGATHRIVSELLGCGIEPYEVSKRVYENKTLGEIRLLAKVLSGLNVTADGRIAYIAVRKEDLEHTKTRPVSCENFVNFARSIKGVEVAVFFRENISKKGLLNVSFRSSGNVDVNNIAASFGGGGHKNASGCVIEGQFEGIKKRVLNRISDEFK
ncbi:MAG: bifunctional oligoribonuclease/PAP phosphatase NrnA [Candidatus Omnitrophota bacterium]